MWEKKKVYLLRMFLKDINREQFQHEIKKTKYTADFLAKNFPQSNLAYELKESVTDFYQLTPVILILRSPALQERH